MEVGREEFGLIIHSVECLLMKLLLIRVILKIRMVIRVSRNRRGPFFLKREDMRIIDIVADRLCNGQYVVPRRPGQKDEETKMAIMKARAESKLLKRN
jgi:hypothetical protein